MDAHSHVVSNQWTMVCATSSQDWPKLSDRTFPTALGLHPWFVCEQSLSELSTLQKFLRGNPSLDVGEIGLDKFRPHFKDGLQLVLLQEQLKLAWQLGRRVHLHCVQAHEQLFRECAKYPDLQIILHAFHGSPEWVGRWSKLDTWFSLGVRELSREKVDLILSQIPSERLLLESDATNLAQCDLLVQAYELFVQKSKLNYESVQAQIFANWSKLFNLV